MDIIIGSGISGLSYANFCGHNNYLIIEKENEPGGYCRTIRKDGFTWDYSGHFFHFRDKKIKKFLIDRMNVTDILTLIRRAQIKYKQKNIDFPFQKNIHQLPKAEFIDCLYDLFERNEKENYDSFKEMLYGKFGKSISEKFLIPYNEKLYACDLNTLDVGAMGRFFPYAEKEDIIKNFKEKDSNYYNNTFTYSKTGAIEYINALLLGLDKDKLLLNERVISIDTINQTIKTNKQKLLYNRLISTIPFPNLLDMCEINYDKKIYSWNKVLVFNLGFDKKGNDKINHWVYYPEKKYSFYRIGYYDNILSDNRMSLYVEIGFRNDDQIDVKKELEKTLADLKKAKVIVDHNLVSYHYVIMDPAYVHIKSNSNNHKNEIKEVLSKTNIYSIGRYGDWKYCSIEDNIIEAKNLADEIKRNL